MRASVHGEYKAAGKQVLTCGRGFGAGPSLIHPRDRIGTLRVEVPPVCWCQLGRGASLVEVPAWWRCQLGGGACLVEVPARWRCLLSGGARWLGVPTGWRCPLAGRTNCQHGTTCSESDDVHVINFTLSVIPCAMSAPTERSD